MNEWIVSETCCKIKNLHPLRKEIVLLSWFLRKPPFCLVATISSDSLWVIALSNFISFLINWLIVSVQPVDSDSSNCSKTFDHNLNLRFQSFGHSSEEQLNTTIENLYCVLLYPICWGSSTRWLLYWNAMFCPAFLT